MSRQLAADPFTGCRYVPKDYDGPVDRCTTCGNPAPAEPRNDAVVQCSPCFIGNVGMHLASLDEARWMRRELLYYLREQARGPVKSGGEGS